MTVAHARALLPVEQAVVELHQPQRELAALGALARWALRFSPIVAVDPPDGLLIDVAGCRRLFGDESRHVHLIGSATERLGFCARMAAAWGGADDIGPPLRGIALASTTRRWSVSKFVSPRWRISPSSFRSWSANRQSSHAGSA